MKKKLCVQFVAVIAAVLVVSAAAHYLPRWCWQDSVSPHLPAGLSFSDPIRGGDRGVTVEEVLKEIGAHVENGILLDATGFRIEFRVPEIQGHKPFPHEEKDNQLKRQKKAEEDKANRIRVIYYWVGINYPP